MHELHAFVLLENIARRKKTKETKYMQVLVVTLRKTKKTNIFLSICYSSQNDYTMLVYFILTLHFSQKLHFIKQWGRVAWTSDFDLVLKRTHYKSTRKVERNYAATSQNIKKIPTLMNRPHLSRVIIPKGDAIFSLSRPHWTKLKRKNRDFKIWNRSGAASGPGVW